ncbi:MAG: APC family permease, partial [Chitinophagaceae bacterium]
FIEEAFGPYAGFLAGNMYVFGSMASDAALANALADTLQYFLPALRVDFNRIIFMFLLFGGLTWLNISSVKNGVRFIFFTSIVKFIPLILLVFLAIPHVEANNLVWTVEPTAGNIGPAALLLFFAFLGLETSLCNGGEIKNPARNVPLGLLGGLAIVLLLYVSLQLVTQGTLGNDLTNHKDAPLAALANIVMGKTGMLFIVIVTAVSILGSLSGEILCIPRILFAAARNNMMPKLFARVHPKFATPHISIAVYAAVGFIMAVSGGFKQLAIFASASLLLIYLGVALAAILLQKKQSKEIKTKGFRMPGGPVIPLLGAAAVIWLLSNSSKPEVIGLSIFIGLFSVVYFFMLRGRKVEKQGWKKKAEG